MYGATRRMPWLSRVLAGIGPHRLLVVVVMLTIGACAKPFLPPHIEPAGPSGNDFEGALTLLKTHTSLHVLWIHGMCPHSKSDWAQPRVEALAKRLGIDATQSTKAAPIGNFVYRYSLAYQNKPMILDMIVWSELIAKRRASLCFDSRQAETGPAHDACGDTANFPYRRAIVNDALKSGLMNACLADALIYVGAQGESVREQIRPDIEAALSSTPDGDKPAVLLVSESLGSKVLFDILRQIMNDKDVSATAIRARTALRKTQQLMMFANQIPILDLTGPESKEKRALGERAQQGEGSSLRAFIEALQEPDIKKLRKAAGIDKLVVVAFSDPNDALSYRLPDGYFPKTWNIDVVNVLPSNDYVWFGLIEHPLNAHQHYTQTDAVMDTFFCGNPIEKGCLIKPRR